MTETLKALLQELRQHPAFPELLKAVEKPRLPRFKKGQDVSAHGALAIQASGALDQHERWLDLLTGTSSREDE